MKRAHNYLGTIRRRKKKEKEEGEEEEEEEEEKKEEEEEENEKPFNKICPLIRFHSYKE